MGLNFTHWLLTSRKILKIGGDLILLLYLFISFGVTLNGTQGLFLAKIRGPYGVLLIEPGTTCKVICYFKIMGREKITASKLQFFEENDLIVK